MKPCLIAKFKLNSQFPKGSKSLAFHAGDAKGMENTDSLLWRMLATRPKHNSFLSPVLSMEVPHRPCSVAPFSPNIFIKAYRTVLL